MPDRATDRPPELEYTYTCRICGRVLTIYRDHMGSLPTICPECKPKAAAERVKRWRERHPDRYKEANRRTTAQRRARQAAERADDAEK